MPRYDYFCVYCRETTELTHPIADLDVRQECPKCERGMVRQPSAPGFALKGGCWAHDGYSGNNPQGVKERK